MNLAEMVASVRSPSVNPEVNAESQLPRVLELSTRSLRLKSGHSLEEVASWSASYYGEFFSFVSGSSVDRDRFRRRLAQGADSDPKQMSSLIYRGAQVWAAREFGIPYEASGQLLLQMAPGDLPLSLDECLDLVLDNYLSMVAQRGAHQVVGELDDCGRGVIFEGIHRALINLANGVETTPVAVVHRSPEWLKFVSDFESMSRRLYGKERLLYHSIQHPDFAHFEVIREDRSQAIIQAFLNNKVRRVLDCGAMIGFYSHALAGRGMSVVAIEHERTFAEAMERLSQTYGVEGAVQVRHQSLYALDYLKCDEPYDAALMLSILYHLLRNDEAECLAWLDDVKSRVPLIVADTEPRTGILPRDRLVELFPEYKADLIYRGKDDREIFTFHRVMSQ